MKFAKFSFYLFLSTLPIFHCAAASAYCDGGSIGSKDPSKNYSSPRHLETRIWIFPVSDPEKVNKRKTLNNLIASNKLNTTLPAVSCSDIKRYSICETGQYESRGQYDGDLIVARAKSGVPISINIRQSTSSDLFCYNYKSNRLTYYEILPNMRRVVSNDAIESLPAIGVMRSTYDITPALKYGNSYF